MTKLRTEPTLKNLTASNYGQTSKHQNEFLQRLGQPHTTSFNFMLKRGFADAVPTIPPVEFELSSGDKIKIQIEDVEVQNPRVPQGTSCRNSLIYPTECRQRHATYRGALRAQIGWSINGVAQTSFVHGLGEIPIMVKSNVCNISKMSPKELVEHNEHEQEWGGYFIIKGLERLIRMIVLQRRNYPIALKRPTWKKRGKFFSDLGIQVRTVSTDQTATTNIIHYLTNGTAKLMFSHRKTLYFVPICLMLRCLKKCPDQEIFKALVAGYEDDTYYSRCVLNMLRSNHENNLHSQEDCKNYIGESFRVKIFEVPPWESNSTVTDFIINNCVMIHLKLHQDKFNALVHMTQKLFALAKDKCQVENADAVMMQEVLVGGHLYLQIIKEKLGAWLYGLKAMILKKEKSTTKSFETNLAMITSAAKLTGGLQSILETFLATGNLSSHTGLGIMQEKGLTIMAENINRMRYMSHFRAVHRGAFFVEMRTTEARQLLPDAWGFICPVHTPDGTPCGLLNHLTMNAQITDAPDPKKVKNIPVVLVQLGMIPIDAIVRPNIKESYVTSLDGKILGYIPKKIAGRLVDKLRLHKIEGEVIPNTTEIVLVPMRSIAAQYPGLFLFTGAARMVRPCIHLASGKPELIGTFEQVYLDICIKPEELYKGVTTHMELSKTSFMSNLAQLIPMPDCNQSPRNMYQCQMGKQTMGTPIHTWDTHADTKLYRLQTPASPLFRPVHHDNIGLDDFPMGTNAIVAVISYTGYDMEDAMVINKSSYERGLAHGSILKSEVIQLKNGQSYFGRDPHLPNLVNYLDIDGLPHPGSKLFDGQPYYSFFDADENRFVVKKFKGSKEMAMIDSVRLCGEFTLGAPRKAIIVFRIPRNPSVGDKFASRAGQKGICSLLWPAEDLPFTETGLVPDIVFNPHGFPSRMTIAMMIEIMAGKSAALHGLVHDATPFRFTEDDTAIDYFGRLLEAGGYNYYGTEPMYSGIDGRELNAHIFFGVCHYQRLRHMVADKWQVRRTGPTDSLTRQPIKGRKRGGGVRFGEMERDGLISHGAAFLLQDRLFHCSDKSLQKICAKCGSLLAPITLIKQQTDNSDNYELRDTCLLCKDNGEICSIEIPYIFKYLVSEFAAVNIKVTLDLNVV